MNDNCGLIVLSVKPVFLLNRPTESWRCLYKAMEEKTSKVAITILACCVLHNICIDVGDPSPIDILGDDDNDMDQSLNGDISPIASDVRDKIMDYLSA